MRKIFKNQFLIFPQIILLGMLACADREAAPDKQASPSVGDQQSARAELEYEQLQTELNLALTGKPYLAIDFSRKMISIRLKGAVVWDYPIDYEGGDSVDLAVFQSRFQGRDKKLVQLITEKYLFKAAARTPDSVLAVIGEAVNVDPDLLQRDVPERFQLAWKDDVALEIRTDISGQPVSRIKNAIIEIRQVLRRPLGRTVLVLNMGPEDALTLYRVATAGMPTLVIADNY